MFGEREKRGAGNNIVLRVTTKALAEQFIGRINPLKVANNRLSASPCSARNIVSHALRYEITTVSLVNTSAVNTSTVNS